jgi:hypothetical protein
VKARLRGGKKARVAVVLTGKDAAGNSASVRKRLRARR